MSFLFAFRRKVTQEGQALASNIEATSAVSTFMDSSSVGTFFSFSRLLYQASVNEPYDLQRCLRLKNTPDAVLAQQYLTTATQQYETTTIATEPPRIKGTHIHKRAADLAYRDKSYVERVCNEVYPFAIEQCYLKRIRMPFCFLGSSRPDLLNPTTGDIFDHKTGVAGTSEKRHNAAVSNVPKPSTASITSFDVKLTGVEEKFKSFVP